MFALRRLGIRARLPAAFLASRKNAMLHLVQPSTSPPPPNPIPTTLPKPDRTLNASNDGTSPETTSIKSAISSSSPKTNGRNRRLKRPPKRPPISSKSPRKWNRPLAPGVLPAYDEALKVIKSDSSRLKEEAEILMHRIEVEAEAMDAITRDEEKRRQEELLEAMREKLYILQVQSEVNLPEVRWKVSNAMVDMSIPVHRHLMEHKWRKEGQLDLLMERIYQMKVIPDVLPELHPTLDLRITAMNPLREYLRTKKMYIDVEPGVFLTPEQTRRPPKLYANVFHVDCRLYTMLLVDLDVPDEENKTFKTYLHWMKPNIPLSAMHQTRILDLNTHTQYIPPHPQRGTPYHRYVLLLLLQPPVCSLYTLNAAANVDANATTSQRLSIPIVPDAHRFGFDVRAFTRQWGLDSLKGGGAHMWREVWSPGVSVIYKDLLKLDEPKYGVPPKANSYADLKDRKRYL